MTPGYEGDGASDPTVDLLPPKIAASLTTPVEEEEAPKTPLPPGPVVDEGGVVASDDTAAAGERREDGTSSPPNSAVEDLAESGVRGFCAPAPMSIEPWGGGFFNGDEEDNTVEMEELSELPQEPGRHPPPPRVLTKLMSFLERRERGGGEGGDDGADANADADGAATSVGEETDPILPRGDEEGGGGGLKYSPPASWSIRRGGGVSGGGIDYSPPASWSVRRGGEGGGGGDGPEPREGRGGGAARSHLFPGNGSRPASDRRGHRWGQIFHGVVVLLGPVPHHPRPGPISSHSPHTHLPWPIPVRTVRSHVASPRRS